MSLLERATFEPLRLLMEPLLGTAVAIVAFAAVAAVVVVVVVAVGGGVQSESKSIFIKMAMSDVWRHEYRWLHSGCLDRWGKRTDFHAAKRQRKTTKASTHTHTHLTTIIVLVVVVVPNRKWQNPANHRKHRHLLRWRN